MQTQRPYQKFLKLGEESQLAMINQEKQSEPSQLIADLSQQYPENNFIQLNGKQNKKAIKLHNYRYAPTTETVKGVIVSFHSINMHQNLYVQLAKNLSQNGYVFTGFDMRGHGKSEGERGYLDDSKEILKDTENFLIQINKIYKNVPLYLFGHGSGATIALNILAQLKIKIDGLIFTGPSLKKPGNSKMLSAVSDVALKFMPNKAGLFQQDFQRLFKNPNASKYLSQDKNICHEKVMVGTLTQLMTFMKNFDESTWKKLETPPILILQGQYDKVADPINSIKFYEAIKTKDKTLQWFPTLWNGFYLEKEYPEVQGAILKWLNKRT